MTTTNMRALQIKAKVNEKFEGAFGKGKKRKKTKKALQTKSSNALDQIKEVQPIQEIGHNLDTDMSPPADDHERLSKQDNENDSDSPDDALSSEGELPRDDVPELFSDEEEEADTREMQDPARRAMQGSFLPIIAILETQVSQKLDPNMTIDTEQGLVLLHSAAFYGKIKPVRALIE